MIWTVADTPIGSLLVRADRDALTHVTFEPFEVNGSGERREDDPLLQQACTELAEYFAGERTEFDVPLRPRGSAFQLRVWDRLRQIPYGETTSYGRIAAELILGPHGARAVGAANGSNPIPVIVPCHRVIGSDGTLTGYGGGIERKQVLLALEQPGLF